MIKAFAAALLLAPALAFAQPLKTITCENAGVSVAIAVNTDSVEWTVTRKSDSSEQGRYAGYLFADKDLTTFSSTDDGSDLEVNGNSGVISYGDQIDAQLSCK